LFGGLAISITALAIGAAIRPNAELRPLLLLGAWMAALGLTDDLRKLKPATKLVVEVLIASSMLFFGYRLHWTASLVGDAMLTLFWVVGITNAFNLLDNMDGLSAGIATIAGVFVLAALAGAGDLTGNSAPLARYVATLLGATIGFLTYNAHPASIFMGDTGSLFLGFNFAALTLSPRPETGKSGLLSVIAVPVLLMMIPIFDTTFVTSLRLLSGRRPSQGGRDHASHRLVTVGLSERMAVTVLWVLALAGGMVALLLQRPDPSWGLIGGLMFTLALVVFAVYLARIRVYDGADLSVLRGRSLTPLVSDFIYNGQVGEILLDCCLIPLAYYTAYRLRFEGESLASNYRYFLQSMPLVLTAQLLAFLIVGAHRGAWRQFGMLDVVILGKGVLLGTVGSELLILYAYRFEGYSRSVFVIHAVVLLLTASVARASFRLISEFVARRTRLGQRCVIYGTGGPALSTIREAFGSTALKIVGFIDDDPHQHRTRLHGYSVVGDFRALLSMVQGRNVDCVVVNAHRVEVERLRVLEAACCEHHVELLRLQIDLKPLSAVS
jgi:UDP-GlcNAc:undecaprenyl-phosphate GlcNAc-1-phosphate transferase